MGSRSALTTTCVVLLVGFACPARPHSILEAADDWSYTALPVYQESGGTSSANASHDVDCNYQVFSRFVSGDLGLSFIARTLDDFDSAAGGRDGLDYYAAPEPVRTDEDDFDTLCEVGLWEFSSATGRLQQVTVAPAPCDKAPEQLDTIEYGFRTREAGITSGNDVGWFVRPREGLPADAADYCPNTDFRTGHIPEPGTTLMFLLGLGGAALLRRGRRA